MKKVLILALALILLLGVAANGTFGLFSDAETSEGNTFTAWVEEVVCAKFNVADDEDNKIYKYNASGNLVGSFALSGDNGRPTGVAAVVEDHVYVLDHADKQVYQYTCSGTLVDVSKTLLRSGTGGASLGNPGGLAIYDNEMWVVDFGPNKIFGYVLSGVGGAFPGDGSLNASWEINLDTPSNQQATGLAIDSSYLYVLDSADHQFYRYEKTTGSVTVSKVLKDMGGGALSSPAGAMLDGTWLWVVDSGTNKMYRYDNIATSLFPDDGNPVNADWEFPLDINNTDASGV